MADRVPALLILSNVTPHQTANPHKFRLAVAAAPKLSQQQAPSLPHPGIQLYFKAAAHHLHPLYQPQPLSSTPLHAPPREHHRIRHALQSLLFICLHRHRMQHFCCCCSRFSPPCRRDAAAADAHHTRLVIQKSQFGCHFKSICCEPC